jgi:hypothetical protein
MEEQLKVWVEQLARAEKTARSDMQEAERAKDAAEQFFDMFKNKLNNILRAREALEDLLSEPTGSHEVPL